MADIQTHVDVLNGNAQSQLRSIIDRAERLDFTSAIVGRVLTSSTELTRGDASRLIDHMARELGEVAPDEDPS